jgi:hypothetical protein
MRNYKAMASGKSRWLARWLSGNGLLITLVFLVGTLASGNAYAAPEYRVLGTIENVDHGANTITVRLSDGTDKMLLLAKRLKVNGREEPRDRAESALSAQERAVIYYTDKGGDETAVDVELLNHAMRRTVTGTLVSADKSSKTVVLRTENGKEETFRVQSDAVIETSDSVVTFDRFEPQSGAQITLHYEDPAGMLEVSRIKH